MCKLCLFQTVHGHAGQKELRETHENMCQQLGRAGMQVSYFFNACICMHAADFVSSLRAYVYHCHCHLRLRISTHSGNVLGEYTVFDLISGLSAYVILGPKNRPN